ncbi:MAG TPA: methionine biosynthesis protein MetW [Caulobacteraceae bacterium]|nr:methionine biosynthesis protein MetW [Caulobacteraceae bacterium]
MRAVAPTQVREDLREITRLVPAGAKVIDVGCGEGELLELLERERGVDGRGLEISPQGVSACLARGLSVAQGDADHDLDYFPENAFDYAILSQTLPQVRSPRHVLTELLRVGRKAIVSAPNFGHWRVRLELLFHGRMPETAALPDPWWATANIHLCTLADLTRLCDELGLTIEACAALSTRAPARRIDPRSRLENWRAEAALFVLSR